MKRLLSFLLSAVMLVTGLSASVAFAAVKPTAKSYEEYYTNYDENDNELLGTGLYTYRYDKKGNLKYALDENGKKVTGWAYVYLYAGGSHQSRDEYKDIAKYWYYFGEDYKPLKGLQRIGKCKYYFKENGTMAQNEAVKVGKRLLWFGKNGALLKNKAGFRKYVQHYDDFAQPVYATVYLNKIGVVLTGWRKLGGKWYHFSEANGVMADRPTVIDGKLEYFTKKGVWKKNVKDGWKKIVDQEEGFHWYYFRNGEGALGWKKIKGNWYYFFETNGIMMENGIMELDGVTYEFDENGVCLNP